MWTFRHFTSHWEKVKIHNNKLTVIQEHLLCCNYSPSFEDFSILTTESNDFKLKIIESLLIARDKPILNKADSLYLWSYFNVTSVVIIWFFIGSYDVHLSHCAYAIVVCSVFIIIKCSGNCNNINNPYAKLCVPYVSKNMNECI